MPPRRSTLVFLVGASLLFARFASADEATHEGNHEGNHEAPREGIPEVALPGPHEPLAGLAGERAFLRSPGNEIILFPGFLLQTEGSLLSQQNSVRSGFSLRRARLELAGWLGPMFYFDVGGDFAPADGPGAPGGHPPADAYVAFAPLGDLVIVQAGQFDTPFSLENRTLDAYTPFIERALPVRVLTVPYNKDLGVMVHGADDARTVYYSGGIFNGDGPGVRNADNQVDFIGRLQISPLARSSFDLFREASFGASAWYGRHVAGREFPTQTTPGGFVFFKPSWPMGQSGATLDLVESGTTMTLGGEVSLPVGHQFGLRAEGFLKKQDLDEDTITTDGSPVTTLGRAKLNAFGGYADAWLWLIGDDRLLPRPGYELPKRLGRLVEPTARSGLMVVARGEVLQEDLTSTQTVNADPNLATTRLVTGTLGVNYWYGRRVRASLDYILTFFSGTTENVKTIIAANNGKSEQEILLMFAMGL